MAKSFHGITTALITPFDDSLNVHYGDLEKLVFNQLENGIHNLVVLGTTAETPTLDSDEKEKIFKTIQKITQNKIPLIVGSGTNSTKTTIEMSLKAKSWGADALLVVVPYYNKPTQEGLWIHFSEVAKAVGETPIILYDVPGRTAKELELPTIKRLIDIHSNIVGIKDATGSIGRITELRNLLGNNFQIYSGDDPLFFPSISCGADGVISVASNVIPKEMLHLHNSFQKGDLPKARDLHNQFYDFFNGLFFESNPTPVKWIAKKSGLIQSHRVRPPLSDFSEKYHSQLEMLFEKVKS